MTWRRCRLDWLATEERRTVDPADILEDTVFHYSIPALDEIGDGRLEPPEDIGSGKLLLRGGEVLISKLNPRLPRVLFAMAHNVPTLASTEFIALQPRPDIDKRFLRYWLSSERLRQMLNGATMSVTRSQQRVRPDILTKTWLSVPSGTQQRAIADYLDAETARIDALIAKKRRMVELLGTRREALIEQSIRGLVNDYGSEPLKRVTQRVEVGIVITPSAWYAATGVLALRGLNIRPGGIDLGDVVQISHEGQRLHQKSVLRAGDLAVVRTGQAGAAAVIPDELHGCNCIDLVIVRTGSRIRSKFLEFVLNSDWTQKHIREYSVGTIQSHFNVGAMKEVPVPVPPPEIQGQIVDSLESATEQFTIMTRMLSKQIDFLQERRQALITAAVTGELDIPLVAA